MMVWSLFIIGLMGLFFYNKLGSIIPMVVLPTTNIIEPRFFRLVHQLEYVFYRDLGLLEDWLSNLDK